MFLRNILIVTWIGLFTGPLRAAEPEAAVSLFNGKDFTGWAYETQDPDVPMERVWSVRDGVIECTGRPAGYIVTEKNDFVNYVLTLEWRWPGGGGNSGVLLHTSTRRELDIWPKSLEVQLGSGDAGDLWVIGTTIEMENVAERRTGRRHRNLTDDSEKPPGEWNQLEVTCAGADVKVKINGDLVNHATHCSETQGAIGLQSEGRPIEFRNIQLRRLDN